MADNSESNPTPDQMRDGVIAVLDQTISVNARHIELLLSMIEPSGVSQKKLVEWIATDAREIQRDAKIIRQILEHYSFSGTRKMKVERIEDFGRLLRIAAELCVQRQLNSAEVPVRLHNDDEIQSAVQMTNGSILVCVTSCSFHGTDVTPPEPTTVAFYLIE